MNMKRILLSLFMVPFCTSALLAQDGNGFKKENLFTGGSISLAFSGNTFLVGGSPVLGYSLAHWIDGGLVVNYNYTSYRDYPYVGDRLRESVYGGGLFTKIYPVRFIFLQAQAEHNFIKTRYLPYGLGSSTTHTDVNSLLVGGGYTTGRFSGSGQPFFYLAVLVDVSGNSASPYTDALGRVVPIIRAGIQVPLFQGKNRGGYEDNPGSGGGKRAPRNYNRY
ncbi:MAG TPA: hypothetical protein VG870_00390 [Chitinophagaceae bacterium]|nr:hypothetical protein [Chitinophagaceae bacterium]